LRGDKGNRDSQQAPGHHNRDQLAELPGQDGDILHLRRASIEPARAVECGDEIGRHRPQHSGSHDDESHIEVRHRGKPKHR
jgi:hypothetical protein